MQLLCLELFLLFRSAAVDDLFCTNIAAPVVAAAVLILLEHAAGG